MGKRPEDQPSRFLEGRELAVPDLPEFLPTLSDPTPPGYQRGQQSWGQRLRGALLTYLPLMLMALLAIGTWWLVKNAPKPVESRAKTVVRHDPDYTMARFSIERFDAQGRPAARLLGEQLRHFPDSQEIEIDAVHLIATGLDGRISHATARRAVVSGDGAQVRMEGGARVVSTGVEGDVVEIESEHLLAEIKARKLMTDHMVLVRQGQSQFTAEGLLFDQAAGTLSLHGKVQMRLTPQTLAQSRAAKSAPTSASGPAPAKARP